MKKLFTVLIGLLFVSLNVSGQNGYVIEYLFNGPLYSIDLADANKTLIGNTMNNLGAGDIGPDGILYTINSSTNMLYQIDVTDGSFILIGSITPPPDHMWTGMTYDETNEIMYGYSAHAVSSGEGSLHIIDVSNGSYTLVGTQTTATAIACIAITDDGQIYGMQLEGNAKIYEIETSNGAVSLVGSIGQGAAGMGHGMDYCSANQTMYLTTYNSSTWENTLRIVNLTSGSTTQIGGLLGGWTGLIAIPSAVLTANFSADDTNICIGGEVDYTPESTSATSWLWTFEAGDPPTSTDQDPTITYNTAGLFDVTLEVSDGTSTDTYTEENMISVAQLPSPEVIGETDVCINNELTYSTINNTGSSYYWEVEGGSIINGTGTNEVSILWTTEGQGSILVTETSVETCEGTSETISITVDACVGLAESSFEGLKVFPNPAQDYISITFASTNADTYEISIYNQFGSLVYNKPESTIAEQDTYQIDISSLVNGLYFIKMQNSSNQVYQIKFEKIK